MRSVACCIAFTFAAFVGHVDARTIKNVELGYTLVVPDRFQPITPQAGMVDAFATSDPSQGMPDAIVSISRLHGTIGRDHLDPSKTPIPGVSDVHVRQQRWKTFDVDVIEGQVVQGDVRLAIRGVQVPLKREAIQLNIAVLPGKEAQADALLSELLTGLDGPTNWLTDEERGERLGSGIVKMAFFGGLLIGGLVTGFRALKKRRRRVVS
jgi:hypothetical protein